jgi:hypothetical protein
MTDKQPEALRLADELESFCVDAPVFQAADELRRLHEENDTLKKCLFQMQNAAIELAKPEAHIVKWSIPVDPNNFGEPLAKPEQEPVAWMYKGNFHDFDPSEWASPEYVVTPLYTAPPRKEWIGLMDGEIRNGQQEGEARSFRSAVQWAEAKLKEKNSAI